jgi:transcriptional regulator with XRE-family HTH domain
VTDHHGPVLLKRRIGRRVRRLREQARMTLEAAAVALEFSTSKLSRIETGATLLSVHELKSMMDLYDQRDDELFDMARKAKEKGWWHSYGVDNKGYVAMEADACLVHNFQLLQIPGLMQTPAYARARLEISLTPRSAEWLDQQVTIRSFRQRRLLDPAGGLELIAVVDEAALRKPVGGIGVLQAQLGHMAKLATLPNVTLHVLPTAAGAHLGMDAAFTILTFPDGEDPDLAYLSHVAGSLHIEKDAEVDRCKLAFERLRSAALPPEESIMLVQQVAQRPQAS